MFGADLKACQAKVFQRPVDERLQNAMKSLTEEDLERIKRRVQYFLEIQNKKYAITKTLIYNNAIYEISHTIGNDKQKAENIIFLILACDPNLSIYHLYKSNITLLPKDINLIEDKDLREQEIKNHIYERSEYKNEIKKITGIYTDSLSEVPQIYKYEILYHNIFERNKLEEKVARNYTNELIEKITKNNINEERLNELNNVLLYIESLGLDYNTLVFNIIYHSKALGIKNIYEGLIILINIYKPELINEVINGNTEDLKNIIKLINNENKTRK